MGCSGIAHALHELSCFKCINRSLLNFGEGHDILQTLGDFQFSCVFVSGHDRALGTLMILSQLWQATMRQYNASVIAVCSPCNISRRNLPFTISSARNNSARSKSGWIKLQTSWQPGDCKPRRRRGQGAK